VNNYLIREIETVGASCINIYVRVTGGRRTYS
jgi:hypothetical protein